MIREPVAAATIVAMVAMPLQRTGDAEPLLVVRGLSIVLDTDDGPLPLVREVDLEVGRGECVGLVGESGSGKTLTALALMRLLPPGMRVTGGEVRLGGDDVLRMPEGELRQLRGGRVGMVFQEPATAFDPMYTLGFQIAEAVRAHRRTSRREARDEAARLLDRVALADARRRLDDYPHQLSGGQRQRAMIAMALAGAPDLLLADEPTTALDVTLQAQILELLQDLQADLGLSVLLITHDLGVVAETCDRVVVMRHGQVVEEAGVEALFRAAVHPYTRELLAAVPRLAPSPPGLGSEGPGGGSHA